MKKIIFIIFTCQIVSADMAPGPGYKKYQLEDKKWNRARCNQPANLIICHFSKLSPNIDDCKQYAANPTQYKFLARKGIDFGDEKYCIRVGKDK